MSTIDTLIYDRQIEDVLRVKTLADAASSRALTDAEVEAWNAASVKGAYNTSDINRVGEAVILADGYLSTVQDTIDAYRTSAGVADDAFFDAGILPPEEAVIPRTDFAVTEPPIMADGLQTTVRAAQVLAKRVRIVLDADFTRFDYIAANALERAVYDAYQYGTEAEKSRKEAADRIAQAWYYSGDLVCGEMT